MARSSAARPTITEIAQLAGVSKSTVSRVVTGSPGVSPPARERVEAVIAQYGYTPNRAARNLVTRSTGSIGLVVSEGDGRVFSDPFFASIVRGATQVVRPLGIHLVLLLADDGAERREILDYLRRRHVDGVLLVSTHTEDPLPQSLIAAGLPAVLSGRPLQPTPISYVDVDSVAGAELAVAHLVERGRTHIATVAGPSDMAAGQDRLTGWAKGLRALGLPAGDDLVAYGDFDRGSGGRAVEALLERGTRFDGLFVASDLMALDVLPALATRGLRVPEDVSVVGFDDSVAAAQVRPALTTVRQPVEAMGAALTRMLLDRIADPDTAVTSQVYAPTLVVRASS